MLDLSIRAREGPRGRAKTQTSKSTSQEPRRASSTATMRQARVDCDWQGILISWRNQHSSKGIRVNMSTLVAQSSAKGNAYHQKMVELCTGHKDVVSITHSNHQHSFVLSTNCRQLLAQRTLSPIGLDRPRALSIIKKIRAAKTDPQRSRCVSRNPSNYLFTHFTSLTSLTLIICLSSLS